MPGGANLVAVVYADWQSADAIAPSDVLEAATELRCPALLIDTWNKSAGTLFDHWPLDDLQSFVRQVREREMIAVVAGSLALANLREAAQLGPDLIAVRGAVCEGGRGGAVSRDRVAALCERLIVEAKSSESAANSV
jgi:uncharacterized protein (UPF0264 family)